MEETPWHKYGTAKNPKCANCMAHCGFEASAVEDSLQNPLKAAWVSLMGPRTSGAYAAEPVPEYDSPAAVSAASRLSAIPVKVVSE